MKIGLYAVAGVICLAVFLAQQSSILKLRARNEELSAQLASFLASENQRGLDTAARPPQIADAAGAEQLRELLRLRGEVGLLRKLTNALAQRSAPRVEIPDTTPRLPVEPLPAES